MNAPVFTRDFETVTIARPPRAWWEMRWFFVLAVVASIAPLVWPPLPPLLDLPGHMARYHVMLGTDAANLGRWYSFAWRPIGYVGVDLIVAGLAPWIGLEPTVKLVAVLIAGLSATGILWVSRESHGRVQPAALFALPLVYNFTLLDGFLNYALGVALAINGFALWLRLGRQDRPGLRSAVFSVFAWVIWATHLFGWIAFGVIAGSAELARRRGEGTCWGRAIWRAGLACLCLAPPALMLLQWRPSAGGGGNDYLATFWHKPGWIAAVLRDRWWALDVGTVAVMIGLIHHAVRSPGARVEPRTGAAALGVAALFIALPFGTANLDARVAPLMLVLGLLAVGPGKRPCPRAAARLALAGLALFLARTAATTASLAIEWREWRTQLAAVDHLPRGARVAAFAVNDCPQGWSIGRINHLPSLALVRRGVFVNDQFDLGTTSLLHIDAPAAGDYRTDPSQIVTVGPCDWANGGIRPLADALAGLPHDAFDYVWLLRPPRLDPAMLRGLTLAWGSEVGALYRIDHPRAAPVGALP